jgi:tRNA A22 N-methylase
MRSRRKQKKLLSKERFLLEPQQTTKEWRERLNTNVQIMIEDGAASLAWWYMPVIPALRRQRQEEPQLKISLGYIVRPCLKKNKISQVLVAHTCNPSYTGGRDQEDRSLKPAWANSLRNPILKKPFTKK